MNTDDKTSGTSPTRPDRTGADGPGCGGASSEDMADELRRAHSLMHGTHDPVKLAAGASSHPDLGRELLPTPASATNGTRSGVSEQLVGDVQRGGINLIDQGGPWGSLLVPDPLGGESNKWALGAISKTFCRSEHDFDEGLGSRQGAYPSDVVNSCDSDDKSMTLTRRSDAVAKTLNDMTLELVRLSDDIVDTKRQHRGQKQLMLGVTHHHHKTLEPPSAVSHVAKTNQLPVSESGRMRFDNEVFSNEGSGDISMPQLSCEIERVESEIVKARKKLQELKSWKDRESLSSTHTIEFPRETVDRRERTMRQQKNSNDEPSTSSNVFQQNRSLDHTTNVRSPLMMRRNQSRRRESPLMNVRSLDESPEDMMDEDLAIYRVNNCNRELESARKTDEVRVRPTARSDLPRQSEVAIKHVRREVDMSQGRDVTSSREKRLLQVLANETSGSEESDDSRKSIRTRDTPVCKLASRKEPTRPRKKSPVIIAETTESESDEEIAPALLPSRRQRLTKRIIGTSESQAKREKKKQDIDVDSYDSADLFQDQPRVRTPLKKSRESIKRAGYKGLGPTESIQKRGASQETTRYHKNLRKRGSSQSESEYRNAEKCSPAKRTARSRDEVRKRPIVGTSCLKPDKYDGTTPLEIFLLQFDNCVEHNQWGVVESLAQLKSALRGTAAQVLMGSQGLAIGYLELREELQKCFGIEGHTAQYRTMLKTRRRQPGESLRALYQDVCRILMLAYPGPQNELRDLLAVEAFIDSLDDVDLEISVKDKFPKNLAEAFQVALRLEANRPP